ARRSPPRPASMRLHGAFRQEFRAWQEISPPRRVGWYYPDPCHHLPGPSFVAARLAGLPHMSSPLKGILERLRPRQYARRPSLILLNGLAEQAESWYRNRRFWGRYFDVHAPNILVYE